MLYIAYYLGRKKENPKATLADRITCFFSRSKYSHVELIYDWSPETKRGRCFSSSPRDGGVRGTTIDFGSGHWEVYELETDKTENNVLNFFVPKIGLKYDWFGAIGSVFPVLRNRDQRWFCSEIIMAFLGYEYEWEYSPRDMFRALSHLQKRVL
jgi:hypothetical protein